MDFNKRIVNLNKRHLMNIMNNTSIADYYQIVLSNGSLQFEINDFKHGEYKFITTYKKNYKPRFYFVDIPDELNHIVFSYLEDFIILECSVDLRYGFPFSKPVWSLNSVYDSFNKRLHISLVDYYTDIVERHNAVYNNDWSPAMGIKSDILIFICRIHHFEVFEDY